MEVKRIPAGLCGTPRSVVIARHGLGPVGEPLDRHGDHLADGVDDGHGPHIEVAAIGLERGITDHLDQTVGEVYKESGQPQRDDLSDPARGKGHAVKFQPQDSPLPGEEFLTPTPPSSLCDHSGQCRPLDLPIFSAKDGTRGPGRFTTAPSPHRHHRSWQSPAH